MYINRDGEIKVRVRGVNSAVRWSAGCNDEVLKAARSGTIEAAEYLKDVIQEKIGTYQSTGGTGGGAWAKLKYETIARKLREFGVGDRPLLASGDLQSSFYIVPGGPGTIAASVSSQDPKLIHHIYGAPRRGIPQRDPMIVTAVEEMDMCHDIIMDAIDDAFARMK